jgi:hypothetical protein
MFCDCNIVSVTADLTSSTLAHTNNEPNSWICSDFEKMEVNDDGHHLMNWTLEGSFDGKNWIELDIHYECRSLIGLNRSATFETSRNEFVRYVRIRQHGKGSNGDDYLVFSVIFESKDRHDLPHLF